jgi:hypothetical protein
MAVVSNKTEGTARKKRGLASQERRRGSVECDFLNRFIEAPELKKPSSCRALMSPRYRLC